MEKNLNNYKIVWHQGKLNDLREGKISSPICVRVKPTNKCNHNCFYCAYKSEISGVHDNANQRDEIPGKKMIEILNNFKEMGVKSVIYSGGGEPLVYPQISETIERTIDLGLDFAMITNGQNLEGKVSKLLAGNALWVRISANDCDAKTFSQTRRCNEKLFYKRNENIKEFANMKNKSCKLGIHFVVHRGNKNKIFDSAEFYKKLGADNIKFVPMWSNKPLEYHKLFREESTKQIKKAKKELESGGFKINNSYNDFLLNNTSEKNFRRCFRMEIVTAIGADCNVYTCPDKSYDEQGKIGSIKNISFKDLWFSDETKNFFKNFNPLEKCKDHFCTNEERNEVVQKFINLYKEHINFM
jgi:MoaA/NifB/PqqE/SkfB family radical SAM enzyme